MDKQASTYVTSSKPPIIDPSLEDVATPVKAAGVPKVTLPPSGIFSTSSAPREAQVQLPPPEVSFVTPTTQAQTPHPIPPSTTHPQPVSNVLDSVDLYGGANAPNLPSTPSFIPTDLIRDMPTIYKIEYARPLDAFFETKWYTTTGYEHFLQKHWLYGPFAGFLVYLHNRPTTPNSISQAAELTRIPLLEARVLWHMICSPRTVAEEAKSKGRNASLSDPDLDMIIHRVTILECLLLNRPAHGETFNLIRSCDLQILAGNNVPSMQSFWRLLARFVALPSEADEDISKCLDLMRNYLDKKENRDVLYSIALVRFLSNRPIPPATSLHQGTQNMENRNNLTVGKYFIENEASGKAANQVNARISGMAVKSWSAFA